MDFSTLKGLTIPEGIVTKITNASGAVLWALKTSRLPDEYQEVEWLIAGDGKNAYIDLGFAFDTKATIYMGQWVIDTTIGAYPFGAAENSGKLRCMLSCPYSENGYLYGSTGSAYISTGATICNGKNEFVMTLEPGNIQMSNLTTNYSSRGTTQGTYTMTNNLYLFAQNYNGTTRFGGGTQISYFKYYDKNDNLFSDLIPCYRKSDKVAGMYDVVRKVFMPSIGQYPFYFINGDNDDVTYNNQVPTSINADGSIYNDGLGYKVGYRVRSGGTEIEADNAVCTGYIPLKRGDTLRIYPQFTGKNSQNTIGFVNGNFEQIGQVTDYGSLYGICTADYRPTTINAVSTLTLTEKHDSSIAYIRVTHDSGDTRSGESLIVTVNEEI